jgi:peroxiredoxin
MIEPFDAESQNKKQTEFPGLALAIASFVLGIVSIPFSILLIGGLFALTGLILAVIHLSQKGTLRSLAISGLCLSLIGLSATILITAYYFQQFRTTRELFSDVHSETFEQWIDIEAPDFTIKDLDGKPIKLSDFKGRRVILDFWATWCPPCKMEIPHFIKLREKYEQNDLVIIGISSEDQNTLRSFADKQKINYPLAIEQDMPAPYSDVTSLPTTFFIDRDGIIKKVLVGYHDLNQLDKTVIELDKKQEPNEPPQQTELIDSQ